MRRRHYPYTEDDETLHDFDDRERVLRILFVDRKGGLTPPSLGMLTRSALLASRKDNSLDIGKLYSYEVSVT